MINMQLLRTFRKNLSALKIAKRNIEHELMNCRAEIQEYELAIEWIERNIKKEKNANIRKKNKSRNSK